MILLDWWKQIWVRLIGFSATAGNFIRIASTLLPEDSGYDEESWLDATGFPNRTDTSGTVNGNNIDIAKTGSSFTVFIAGIKYVYTTTQSADISTNLDETFVYFNASGIQSSTTAWDIESYSAPAFIVYRNNAATPTTVVFEERHAALRSRGFHAWAHSTVGARYKTGLAGTFGATTLSIATGSIRDEDIELSLGSTATAGRLWYRHTGGAAVTWVENRTLPYAGTSSQAQYDNAGTLTNVGNSKYFNTWVYMTNAMTYPVALVSGQTQHNTVALARNESLPSLPTLTTREWKLLYRVTFLQGAGSVSYVEAQDFREVSTGPGSSYTPASHTALTDRDAAGSHPATAISNTPAGSIAATTVQAAINELDTEKLALSGGTMTGDIAMSGTQQITGLAAPDASGEAIRQTAKITEAALESAVDLKHTQHTDTGTTSNTFTVDSDSTTGKIIIDVALDAADKALTLTNAALTDNRTITFPNATGTVALTGDAPTAHAASHITGADKLQFSATARAFGRNTAGSGDVEEVTITQMLDWTS